jgi:3-deoxy-manno-octulosonate cytidylyltransferase (CMP-KDO synthetase)
MIWHVYHQALKVSLLNDLVIATDDHRIAEACVRFKLNHIMTRDDHHTGTDRLVECSTKFDADIFVNVQGDEPMIEPNSIELVTQAILSDPDPNVMASNGYNKIEQREEAADLGMVKVVMNKSKLAMAYSRLPIPYPKGTPTPYYRQLGLYAFRKQGLEIFGNEKPGPLELAEGVEMLRFLENGFAVRMIETTESASISVDTPEDLERARQLMIP